jgi:hypothetical protein
MSQQSEERLPESASADTHSLPTARIVQLKSRQSELQRAIQLRAQQSVERERDLDQERRRPKPLKWLIISAIAAVPVLLTVVAVDGFLRAFHKAMDMVITATPPQGESPAPVEAPLLQSSEPGVILLQPMNVPEASAQPAAPAAEEASPAEAPTSERP